MKRLRLFSLIEGYLEGTLTAEDRAELAAAVKDDPAKRRTFVEQVRLGRALGGTLAARPEAEVWAQLSPLLIPDERRLTRTADAVDARIDRRASEPARWRVGFALSVGLLAAAAIVIVGVGLRKLQPPPPPVALGHQEPAPPAPVPPIEEPRPSPVATTEPTAPGPAPGPGPTPVVPPAPAAPPAPAPTGVAARRWYQELVAAEGPTLAARQDVVFFLGFEGASLRPPPRKAGTATVGPGLSGSGLRVQYGAGGGGLPGGGTRFMVRGAALKEEAAAAPGPVAWAGPDELHLRYYVRLAPDFDFGGGGFLPGLCGGKCGAPRRAERFGDSWNVRLRWTPKGELGFDYLPGVLPKEGLWRRRLKPGVWHCIEVRVKLNTPGVDDGLVAGWLDGEAVAEVGGLRLRAGADLHVRGASFETFFKPGLGGGPARAVEATFDNIVLAKGYIGPRREDAARSAPP